MSDRYTRKDAETAAKALSAACGREYAYRPGAWYLDHNGPAGGYLIVEVLDQGGEHCPLGHRRRSASELCSTVAFALSALREARTAV